MKMKVPQFAPFIGDEEYAAIKSCFTDNWITEGPKAKEFERQFLALTGAKYGVFAPNGTLAIYLALKAAGIQPGDEVIVPDFTFMGSASAVEMIGAVPVFADVHQADYQVNVADCERLVTPRTRAIMPVHIYGYSADMTAVMDFAARHRLIVVEDAAQAVGVAWKGKHCGTFGEVGTFSFFADKTITTGEGGFITTNEPAIYEKLLFLRNQGRLNRGSFIHPEVGYNFRMTDLQIAIGLAQLAKMPEIIRRKHAIYAQYRAELKDVPGMRFLTVPADSNHIPFRVGIVVDDSAQAMMEFLGTKGIEPRSFFYPLHRQPAFQYLKHDASWRRPLSDAYYPNAVHAYEHGVCLPSFPALTSEQISYVCAAIREYRHV